MERSDELKMKGIGYNHFVCDIFANWENVKDEILMPNRKSGSGNGTIHVFLGAADSVLRKEFASYYSNVEQGEDTSIHAIKIDHFFSVSNIISMLGYVCRYEYKRGINFSEEIKSILNSLEDYTIENGFVKTSSLFKLSIGSSKLRPYFKQFESDGVFTKIIRRILLPASSYKISLYKNDRNDYAAFWLIGFDWQSNFEADSSSDRLRREKFHMINDGTELPRQVIYYGAPGTGKSHAINEITKSKSVIRTTFHPDSDYSTFVGAYKPTTKESYVRDSTGRVVVENGEKVTEERIVYTFVGQAFFQAYVKAWKLYASAHDGEKPEEQYLVIEEINRGNCAQIFGDLFQLLDRRDNGFSEYPIAADKDMQKQLAKAFSDAEIPNEIDALCGEPGIATKIKSGELLLLPSNLYIWATMNTSDQSLFPIDSAFKRRWDWKYIPISRGIDNNGHNLQWKISVGNKSYDWWSFIEKINKIIGSLTSSQDKKLGYFFCKAQDGIITQEAFVDKVLFFLWNEVLKDYEKEQDFLRNSDDYLAFDDFYTTDAHGKIIINASSVETLMMNLAVDQVEPATSVDGASIDV